MLQTQINTYMLQTQISTNILQTVISKNNQLINAVTQSKSYKCAKTSELNFLYGHTCMYTTLKFLGKRLIQINPSKSDKRIFSDKYLYRSRLKQGIIIYFEAGSSRWTLQRRIR